MSKAVARERQSLTPSTEVQLFKLDLLPIGVNQQFYFCRHPGVVFAEQPYDHVPCELTEIERNATGEMSSPKFSLPNAKKFASALVVQHKDLVGAELSRTVTYARFLDGQPTADPEAIKSFDIFTVEQKLALNKVYAQWELRVLADTGDRTIPGRTAMKDICPWNYPYWDPVTEQFIIPELKPCPYRGFLDGHMFTKDNEPTNDPALDQCDHFVETGCSVRKPGWPQGRLGFGGFPGMSRIRL